MKFYISPELYHSMLTLICQNKLHHLCAIKECECKCHDKTVSYLGGGDL